MSFAVGEKDHKRGLLATPLRAAALAPMLRLIESFSALTFRLSMDSMTSRSSSHHLRTTNLELERAKHRI